MLRRRDSNGNQGRNQCSAGCGLWAVGDGRWAVDLRLGTWDSVNIKRLPTRRLAIHVPNHPRSLN